MAAAAEVDTINTSELEELVEATSDERESYEEPPADWDFVLIDTRSNEEYAAGHINGAINMPEDEEFAPDMLPEDETEKLVFYGGDCHEWMREAQELGYENIYHYEASLIGWERAGNYLTTTPEHVQALLDSDYTDDADTLPYLIIDTRGHATYMESHVPSAQSRPHTVFEEKFLDYMPAEKDVEIITYCGGFF
ncbi:rhodanese-like domain-containing protein [Halarsenatibacter silvermanii]|uniref:rhodanese-like domain-containing protein n=1 Tax=Halarsenatibacter silvermanii TaxID=321763 RepID=UPI0013564486|nr:rhodanese-like domain-containing protein [Halarsenatibacter silvermanii]